MIAIFEWLHLGQAGVFMYDNATGHGVFSDDALRVNGGVNKGRGGKNAPGAAARTVTTKTGVQVAKAARQKMRDDWFDST